MFGMLIYIYHESNPHVGTNSIHGAYWGCLLRIYGCRFISIVINLDHTICCITMGSSLALKFRGWTDQPFQTTILMFWMIRKKSNIFKQAS